MGLSIRRGLNTVQLGVLSAFRHQRFMCADLRNVRTVEHDDLIGHTHGAESMRYQNRDLPRTRVAGTPIVPSTPGRFGIALEQRVFGLCVERRGRFIEYEQ